MCPEQAEGDAATLKRGTRLGRYEIVEFIAAGGMGEVYRAHDPQLGRDVAVKIIPEGVARDLERLRRFEHEARATSALNHPNIVAVFDIGSEKGRLYFVTELLEGETLKTRLLSGPMSIGLAIDLARQIAAGLVAAHRKGILHRDLKPSNLFLTRDGRIKILDFGLACVLNLPEVKEDDKTGPLSPTPETGSFIGTVGYVSPEQARGKPSDARSDIFAFGAVLYEMLTGRRAFHGDCAIETMNAVIKEQPPPISELRSNVPPFLERVVARCLQKRPRDRFQTTEDLAFALEAASTASLPGLGGAHARRRAGAWNFGRVPFYALAAVVLVLTILFATDLFDRLGLGRRPLQIHSLAVLPLENVTRNSGEEYFVDGLHGELIAKLSKIRSLRVISRTSVRRYRETQAPLAEIARSLGVDAVLEGSVRHSGDEVQATFRLIDARRDQHLWADSFRTQMRDVLLIESSVAKAVAEQISARLSPDEERLIAEKRLVDPEAYQLYLKGRFYWSEATPLALERSAACFREAISRDPGLAIAHVGLVEARGMLGEMRAEPALDFVPQIEREARRAIAEGDQIGEAHAALGFAVLFGADDWNWPLAEREFEQATALSPSDANTYVWRSQLLSLLGRHVEAIEVGRQAQKLDPLNPFVAMNVASRQYYARRYGDALEQTKSLLEIHPDYWLRHWIRGLVFSAQGRHPEAIRELRRAVALSEGSLECLPDLGGALGRAGRSAAARRILSRFESERERRYVPAFYSAVVYTGLGENKQAFEWFERAFDERDWRLTWIAGDPSFDSLRSEKRFQSLLARLHLAQTSELAVP